MTPHEARELLLNGGEVEMVVGTKPADPILVLWLDGDMVMSESVAGWSAGVIEPVCFRNSDYLLEHLSGRRHLAPEPEGAERYRRRERR